MKRSVLFALMVGVSAAAAAGFATANAFAAEAKAAVPDPVEEAEAKIHATVWAVKLTPIGGSPAKAKDDRISFESGKVISDKLAAEGYASSNYTLTVGDDGVPVWETMQSAGEKGVAFWRGELHGEIMRGILSKHPTKGDAEDYSFSGSKTGDTAVVPAPKTTVTNPVTYAAPATPSVAVPAEVKETQPSLPEASAVIDATQTAVSDVQAASAPVNVQVIEPAQAVEPSVPEAVQPAVRQPASVPAAPASVPEKAPAPAKKRSGWLW